jgi:hypothetical protein
MSLASQHGLDPQNIFFGIDIWAQNRPRSFWHPRITWPIFDGGGTNTGFAVTKCAEIGVGAGLFAPGWCWEHFGSTSDRIAVEGAIWRGEKLNMDMRCDCKGGFWERGDVHRTEKYREFPIVKSARKHVAGTDSGFWTDFEKAVVSHDDGLDEFYGGHHMHAQLGAQGIMPLAVENEEDRKIWWEIFDERPSKLTIIAAKSSHEDLRQRYLKLYELGVRVEEGTKLVVRYRGPKSEAPIAAGFLIKFHSSSGESQKFVQLPAENRYDYPFLKTFSHSLAPIIASNAQIIEIGVAVVGDLSDEQEILEISELTIGAPLFFMVNKSEILATNIKITVVGEEEWRHGRLMWQLKGLPEKKSEWWNERTGPVAYFDVGIDGIVHGRAYGLEFVLPDSVMEHWQSRGVSVQLTGVLFGGARLAKIQVLLKGRTG